MHPATVAVVKSVSIRVREEVAVAILQLVERGLLVDSLTSGFAENVKGKKTNVQ